ncbi:hypothetical protein HanRHA438_Chr05g0233511 [Helianthus annuus]|nr:hypothetical protein HanRHA438_Chr05g0233511 [Helianthus annuus]
MIDVVMVMPTLYLSRALEGMTLIFPPVLLGMLQPITRSQLTQKKKKKKKKNKLDTF